MKLALAVIAVMSLLSGLRAQQPPQAWEANVAVESTLMSEPTIPTRRPVEMEPQDLCGHPCTPLVTDCTTVCQEEAHCVMVGPNMFNCQAL